MLFWTIIKVALKSLLANKLRTILAMLGIIIGVGAVISMLAMGAGAQKQVMDWVNQNRPKPGEDSKAFLDKLKKYMEDFQQESTKKIDDNNAALERDYQLRKRSQERLAVNLSRISPASALMFSTMSLARTGVDEHERFLASIRAYKPIFTQWANSRMMRNLDFTGTGQNVKVVLDDMPQHKFEAEALSKSFVRTLPDFGLMIVLILVFFVGAYVSFLKADVR